MIPVLAGEFYLFPIFLWILNKKSKEMQCKHICLTLHYNYAICSLNIKSGFQDYNNPLLIINGFFFNSFCSKLNTCCFSYGESLYPCGQRSSKENFRLAGGKASVFKIPISV